MELFFPHKLRRKHAQIELHQASQREIIGQPIGLQHRNVVLGKPHWVCMHIRYGRYILGPETRNEEVLGGFRAVGKQVHNGDDAQRHRKHRTQCPPVSPPTDAANQRHKQGKREVEQHFRT